MYTNSSHSYPCRALTPSLPPRSDRRPKHVFYSSTAYTPTPSIHLFKMALDPIPHNKTQLFPSV